MDLLPGQPRMVGRTPRDAATGVHLSSSLRDGLHDSTRGAHDVLTVTAFAGHRSVGAVNVTIAARDRIAAWLGSTDDRTRPIGDYGYVATLRVDRSMRRSGIGRMIMQEAIAKTREARAMGAYLEAGPFDLGPPLEALARFYESLGFVATGRETEMALVWGRAR